MTEQLRPPQPGDADDTALVAAYLDGTLGPADERALLARAEAEPVLRGRLDGIGRVRERLAVAGAPEPPSGYGDRLRSRLAESRADAPAPASLDRARHARAERRGPRRRGWLQAAAVAAVVAVLGGGALAVLQPGDWSGLASPAVDAGGDTGDGDGDGDTMLADEPADADAPPRDMAAQDAAPDTAEEDTAEEDRADPQPDEAQEPLEEAEGDDAVDDMAAGDEMADDVDEPAMDEPLDDEAQAFSGVEGQVGQPPLVLEDDVQAREVLGSLPGVEESLGGAVESATPRPLPFASCAAEMDDALADDALAVETRAVIYRGEPATAVVALRPDAAGTRYVEADALLFDDGCGLLDTLDVAAAE